MQVEACRPAYSARHYDLALEQMKAWAGLLVDFKPLGLPQYQTILSKSYANPAFAIRLSEVRRERIKAMCAVGVTRRSGRNRGYVAADLEAYLTVIRTTNCRSKNQFQHTSTLRPGIPTWTSAEKYAGQNPEFRARLDEALAARGWQKGSNFYKTAAGAELQSEKQRERYGYGQDVRDQLLGLVASGISIADALKQEGMPCYGTLVKWRNSSAEFKRRLKEAKTAAKALTAEQREKARAARPKRVKVVKPKYETAVLRGQLLQDALYAAAEKAVPRGLLDHIRDDLKSDLIEAVLLGEFAAEDMPIYVAEYKAAHNTRIGTFKALSLDQAIADDSDVAFVDRLTTDDHNYAD